ncbi:MAG TPA: hypothetical protein VMG38_25595 [Trebonia sp.]|nr:hypothetical protein [Trebonia sp.]
MTDSPDVPWEPPGDTPGEGSSAPTLASATAELYGAPPAEFTQRRKELAAAARAADDRETARLITALRKPTRAAWVVNHLARAEPGTAASLADLAAGLRAATDARDGRRLRDLSARRRALIDGLTDQAFSLADLPDPPPALREEVTATLAAALADPEVASALAAGTLTRAATWSGFGVAPELAPDRPADEPPLAQQPPAAPSGQASSDQAPPEPVPPGQAPPQPVAAVRLPQQARRTLTPPRPADGARPSPIPEAERALEVAAAVAADAAAAEELLEVRVRDLEQQLTTARADLADARRKARRAESAERKARQALTRLRARDEQS